MQLPVIDFIDQEEYLVRKGSRYQLTKSNYLINVVIRFILLVIYK
jgi:hypothetical protein